MSYHVLPETRVLWFYSQATARIGEKGESKPKISSKRHRKEGLNDPKVADLALAIVGLE